MKRICSVTIALLVSLFIYLFYRSEKTLVNELILLVVSYDTYVAIKTVIADALPLSELLIFSIPGGLWVFCVTTLSEGFYIKIADREIQAAVVPVLFAVGLELCQLVHLTNGRFDMLDIASYLLFWSLACYFFEPRESQQKALSPFTLPGFICLACFLSVYLAHVQQ
jgi:hypothetical protein